MSHRPTIFPRADVQVVRGDPDDLEVAALVAGIAATTLAPVEEAPAPHEWVNLTRGVRGAASGTARTSFGVRAGQHGTAAWRWSLHS